MEKNEWIALNFISFCRSGLHSFVSLFIPLFLVMNGISPVETAGVLLIAGVAKIAGAPFAGMLNDIFGTRRMLQIALAGMAAGAFGIAVMGSLDLAIAAALPISVYYVSNNSLLLSIEASLYKKTTDRKIAGHAGEYIAVKQFAWGAAVLAGGYLLLANGYGAIMTGIGVLLLLIIPATIFVRHTAKIRFSFSEYAKQLSSPKAFALALLVFIMAFEWGTEGTVLTLLYREQMGLDSAQIGIVSFIANVAIALVSYMMGKRLAGNAKAAGIVGRALAAGMLIGAAGAFMLIAAHDMQWAITARAIYNIGEAIVQFGAAFMIGTIFARNRVGGANGMMNFVAMIGMAAASFVAGILMAGGIHPYLAVGLLYLAGVAVAWKNRKVFG